MLSDQPNKHTKEESPSPAIQHIPTMPFAVQLQDIVPVEIVARRRFPVEMVGPAIETATHLNIGEPIINPETLQAQILLEAQIGLSDASHPFEISLKLAGLFSYASEYNPEMVRQFLQQGSLSIMLPSVRELLLSLCTRLQIPQIMLPLVQLAPPPTADAKAETTTQ